MAQATNTSTSSSASRPAQSDALARFERQRRTSSPWRTIGRRLYANRMSMVGLFLILFMIAMALLAPLIAPADPIDMTLDDQFQAPSRAHLLGTDDFGRDILSRIIYGSRLSLKVGLISVSISLVFGALVGLVSGYFGGWIDIVIQRFIEIMLAFPELILALAIMAILGPSLRNAMIAIGIASIPVYTRVTRGEVLSLREKEYVEAARASGASHARLIFRHILPNTMSPLMVIATLGIAGAILTASGLSFIGLGAQPPSPEWGAMLASGREYLRHQWWIATFPGIFIALTVLGFKLFGDGLRDALDPRAFE
jgi:peptide/nickel transport system permease protein